jgi:transposase
VKVARSVRRGPGEEGVAKPPRRLATRLSWESPKRGKRFSGKTRKGSPWLRTALVEAAHAAARSKNTYLSAQYHRLAIRRGAKKAAVAVGHSLLVIIYHVLTEEKDYEELGGNYFDERSRQAVEKQLVRRLENLGYQVSLTQTAPTL